MRDDELTPESRKAEGSDHKPTHKRKQLPVYALVLIDVALTGVALCVFSLFHHVLPQRIDTQPRQITVIPETTMQPMEAALPGPTPVSQQMQQEEPEPQPEWVGWCGNYQDKFTTEGTEITENSYRSPDISIEIETVQQNGNTYYVADVYVRSIEFFGTAFAKGEFGHGIRDEVADIAEDAGAIFAVSGDYYGARSSGLVIRNGNLYRDSMSDNDICILYADGTMRTFSPSEFDIDEAILAGAYHSWTFGPKLLENGMPAREFNSTVEETNPRCAMGYYEPGRYCFVLVDGRQKGYSAGMTLTELAALFYSRGCTEAYNLDGGQSAMMVFMGELVNRPTGGGRRISDIIYIGREGQQ